jgi:hypothetical protein
MRRESGFAQSRRAAEILHSAAGGAPFLTAQASAATRAIRQARRLCVPASPREQKSTLSYIDMFTICSPRIGGQAHGA